MEKVIKTEGMGERRLPKGPDVRTHHSLKASCLGEDLRVLESPEGKILGVLLDDFAKKSASTKELRT